MLLTLMTLTALAPQGPGPSLAPVVINEYAWDDSSTDTMEFVELWNRMAAPVDISGWKIQGEEGVGATINQSFTFPAATIINPGQYIVVGNAAVPNVNFVVPSDFLENGPGEGITLRDAALTVMDGVIYYYQGWTNPVPPWIEGTPFYGRNILSEALANPMSMQRKQDGYDSDNNGADFVAMRMTPGAANGSQNTIALNYVQSCDAVAGTSLANDFATSFVAPRTADPASVPNSTASTIILPPSPQGGNLLLMHDPTGGGDTNMLRCAVGEDFLVECYAWVSGGNAAFVATDGECWGIGIGSTDGYGAPPDVPGTYYATTSTCAGAGNREPGGTGVAWMAYTHAAQTSVYLVDFNDGGPGFTILAGPIVATPGVNDGWQRLRIRVSGNNLTANFGGTFACNDGQVFNAVLPLRVAGEVYFQYRECVSANANLRPLMIDNLLVSGIVPSSVAFAGTGSPTLAGIPGISISGGNPEVGNMSFALTGSSFPPGGIAGVIITVGNLLPFGVPIPGTQPGCLLFAPLPETIFGIVFADGGGNATYNLGIPCDYIFTGVPVATQWLVADATLPYSLPIGSSIGMQLVLGNF